MTLKPVEWIDIHKQSITFEDFVNFFLQWVRKTGKLTQTSR